MHTSPLTTVDVSADGKLIASGGYDGQICVWRDVDKINWRAQASDLINHVSFSPDGGRVAAASADGYVYVFNSADGGLLAQLGPHLDDVNAVAWRSDGELLACAMDAKDARIVLWNPTLGRRVGELVGHEHGVFALAFSPDGKELATAAEDCTVRIWRVDDGVQRAVLRHPGDPETVDWSPCGGAVATGCDDGSLRIWDAATGELRAQSTTATAALRLVRFARDGKRLLAGSYEGVLRIHAFPDLTPLVEYAAPFQWERAAAFKGDGVVVGSFGAAPVEHQAGRQPTSPPATYGVNAAATAVDRAVFIGRDDGGVVDVRDGRALYRHPSIVNGVCFSPDGVLTASVDYKGTVIVYDRRAGKIIAQRDNDFGPINTVVFDDKGERLYSAGYDGAIRIWSSDLTLLEEIPAHDGPIKSLTWSAMTGVLVAGSSDDSLSGWREREKLYRVRRDDLVLINSVAASPTRPHVASASRDGLVRIWRADTGELVETLPPAHVKSVKAVAYSPDGEHLLSGAYDGYAHLWSRNPAGGWRIQRLTLHGKPGVPAVAFDGCAAITAGWDGTVGRWSFGGALIAQYRLNRPAEATERGAGQGAAQGGEQAPGKAA